MEPQESSSRRTPLGTGIWYKYRHFVYALLATNVAMVFYTVLNQDQFFKKQEDKPSADPTESKSSKEVIETSKKSPNAPGLQTATTIPTEAESKQAEQPPVDKVPSPPPSPVTIPEVPAVEKKIELPPAPVKQEPPRHVSNNEKVEIYKWMLEEKRKIKPSNSEEKARIDLEKSILKDYIRGKVPSL